MLLLGSLLSFQPTLAARSAPAPTAVQPGAQEVPTRIAVLVLAHGGKFVGDDIGGSLVTLRDALTREVLASGRTVGGSGLPDLPTIDTTRLQTIPEEDAARFVTTLSLAEPRRVEVEAYGPLAAPGSATRTTSTVWLLPAPAITDTQRVVLTLNGLVVQTLSPATHFLPAGPAPVTIPLRVNVTMMCGCPIGPTEPWHPDNYVVRATIRDPDHAHHVVTLVYDSNAPDQAPSQFVASWVATRAGVYEVVVTAHQQTLDNAGATRFTVIIS